jgi:hypothetical protein
LLDVFPKIVDGFVVAARLVKENSTSFLDGLLLSISNA